MWVGLFFLVLVTVRSCGGQQKVSLQIHLDRSNTSIDKLFLSLAFPHMMEKWKSFKFDDPKMRNLAKFLGPVSVRALVNPSFKNVHQNKATNQDMPLEIWEKFYNFMRHVGWDISMNFVNLERTSSNEWDMAKAKHFLDFASAKHIPIPDFQLGNEPNLYHITHPELNQTYEATFKDFVSLRRLLQQYPLYKTSKVSGPEVTRPTSSRKHLLGFLDQGGCQYVDYISYHQYYKNINFNPTYEDFLNITLMSILQYQLHLGRSFLKERNCSKIQRITETSSISGGLSGVADRFVAGFLWIHKLGISALNGIDRIYRFNYWGSSYSLLSRQTNKPTADYFITLLFKRHIVGAVFEVKTSSDYVLAFANCANYKSKGTVAIYMMNVQNQSITVSIDNFKQKKVDLFMFQPGVSNDLLSPHVKINKVVRVDTGNREIDLKPLEVQGSSIAMAPYTYCFVFVPDVDVPLCGDQRFQRIKTVTHDSSTRAQSWAIFIYLSVLVQHVSCVM